MRGDKCIEDRSDVADRVLHMVGSVSDKEAENSNPMRRLQTRSQFLRLEIESQWKMRQTEPARE